MAANVDKEEAGYPDAVENCALLSILKGELLGCGRTKPDVVIASKLVRLVLFRIPEETAADAKAAKTVANANAANGFRIGS